MTRWATLLVRKPLGKVLAAPNGDYALRRTVVSRPSRRTERPTLGAGPRRRQVVRLIRLVSGLMRGHRMSFRGYRQDPKVCDT
jgi:hypothetical protein